MLLITLISVACKVNQPAYVSLYVGDDYEIGRVDTLNHEVMPAMADSLKLHEVIAIKRDKLPIEKTPQQPTDNVTPDTVYFITEAIQATVADSAVPERADERLALVQNDTVPALRDKPLDLQNQKSIVPDTVIADTADIIAEPADTAGSGHQKAELLKVQNDSIVMLVNQLAALQKKRISAPDTVIVTTADIIAEPADTAGSGHQKAELLKVQNDSIVMLVNQLAALQKKRISAPDTVIVTTADIIAEPVAAEGAGDHKAELLKAQIDSIFMVVNQLADMQNQKGAIPDTVFILNVPDTLLPNDSIALDYETAKVLRAQNDSILILQNQLIDLQRQKIAAPDTVYIPKEIIIPTLEDNSQIQPEVDTITINAYYEKGEIKPLQIDRILQQLKQINTDNAIVGLSLTGQTDISGNPEVNKKITGLRLEYMIEKLTAFVSPEKIFVQNLGSKYASKTIVEEERRIEIKVLKK